VLSAQVAVEPGAADLLLRDPQEPLRRLELSDAQAEALEQGRSRWWSGPTRRRSSTRWCRQSSRSRWSAEFPKAVRFLNAPGSPVGFLTDEEVKSRAAAEAGETPEERAAADAPENEEQRAEEAADAADAASDTPEGPGSSAG
jgi:hypothetical protein